MYRVHLQIWSKGMVLAMISSGTREAALEAAKKEAQYFLREFDSVEIIDRPGKTKAEREKAFRNGITLTAADLAPEPSDLRRDCPWKCKIGEENCRCMDEREDKWRIRECSK